MADLIWSEIVTHMRGKYIIFYIKSFKNSAHLHLTHAFAQDMHQHLAG
jgi:hypothetical protein